LQPNGPYAFLGICFGGLIAFEVAKRFEATGETVAFIGGIDIAPDFGKMRFDALRFFIVDILVSRRLLTTKEAAGLKLDMQSLRAAEFPQKIMARYGSRLSAAGVTLQRLTRSFEVFSGVAAISETYQPSGLSSNYHAFWATPLSEWQIDDKRWSDLVHRWSDFAPDVTYHRIEGNHYTALTRAHVEGFQRLLDQEFTKRGI
jgi:thioesterase domain-containing protein